MANLYYCSKCQEHHFTTDICTPTTPSPTTPSKISAGIALVALLGLTACGDEDKDTSDDTAVISDTSTMALYGVPFTDNDNDGWAQEDGDCDDDNSDVNPDAEEVVGDGVDSNCNGEDDT